MGQARGASSAEVAYLVMQKALHWVDAVVGPVGASFVPMPCNDELECDRAVFARRRQGSPVLFPEVATVSACLPMLSTTGQSVLAAPASR